MLLLYTGQVDKTMMFEKLRVQGIPEENSYTSLEKLVGKHARAEDSTVY
jgi:hypothetical protein